MSRIIFALLLYSTSFANLCETDIKDKKILDKYSCKLPLKDGELQALFAQKGCQQFEDSPLKDCYIIRHCPKEKDQKPSYGTTFYYTKSFFQTICKKEKGESFYPLFGLKDNVSKSNYNIKVKCLNSRPIGVSLNHGQSNELNCIIPTLRN